MSPEKPRQIAVQVLKRWGQGSDYADSLLQDALSHASLSSADRALAQELTFGLIRWQSTLDWLIARKTEGRSQKESLQLLLRLGLYQIFWLDRIPDHAAVHQSVQLAKELGFGPQSGFVNAVLRSYLREKPQTQALLQELKTTQPALGFSHPDWLVQRWLSRLGPETLRQLLEWNNSPPPTFARLNSLRTDPEALANQWKSEKVEAIPKQWDWTPPNHVFELLSHPPIASLPSFQQGLFYIQDPSTLLAVHLLNPQPKDAILDSCSAPGGKTTYIAQLIQDQGYIMAQDLDIRRRQLVRENCQRLGIRSVNISRATSTINPLLSEPFDRILVDAPCSNTGVMRRRVDLRWRLQPHELSGLQTLQIDLLNQALPQLKPGGTLVYSTCSLEPEENEQVVEAFTQAHPECTLESSRLLLPVADHVDGAFVARFRRRP